MRLLGKGLVAALGLLALAAWGWGRDRAPVSLLPLYAESGAEYNENDKGWTSSGVLDEDGGHVMSRRSSATVSGGAKKVEKKGKKEGDVMEKKDFLPYGDLAKAATCGCAVCPCRGDDDIDTVSNGGWYWPIESRKLPSETLASKPPCEGEEPPPREGEDYNVEVVRVKPQRPTASLPRPQTRTQVIYRTRYVPIPEKTVVEKAVYVPVYDDPFWNPRADGRLPGEGIGAPQLNPRGALSYKRGAWYESGARRHSMLDALGGTLDADRDIDHPADLGVWWSDSLPTSKMASDSDSF